MANNILVSVPHLSEANGYFGLLTAYYFGGVGTDTIIDNTNVDSWVDVTFTTYDAGAAEGLFDHRPESMKGAIADPYDESTGKFSLEGLTQTDNCGFRSGFTFNPDTDEGNIQARLLFERHSGTTPSTDFDITTQALIMNSGALIDYASEPFITFFVGDTIDSNGPGDAGNCRFQIKSDVEGTLTMRELTWYINRGTT